ncbi:O-antigen ligase family protein [Nocardioides panzhihuensis]|uniref:O-antigen ligase n=1 Tax=Nocardioides panzhihuensis TaxID=860243 RepID=A0A7Z0DI02_9ACTN|nr:O-antigen ligase family protein [Nocardioides panzhihuensis]NYI75702.1 O-antigen ligase [Nocardioides panzhihuensis]
MAVRRGVDAVTWLSLYTFAVFVIPSWLVFRPLGSAGSVSMLMGLGSFAIWVLLSIGRPLPVDRPPQPMRLVLALFLFSVGVTYVIAMSRPISRDEISPADVAILAMVSWVGTLLLAGDAIPSMARVHVLVWRLVVGGTFLALLGLAQFFAKQIFVDRISVPVLTPVTTVELAMRNGLVRPAGTALSPIEYGTLMGMLVPIALHVGFQHRNLNPLVRWAPVALICMIIAASSSRSAYLGAAIAVAVCMIGWSRKQRVMVLGLAVGGLGLVFLVAPRIINSVTGMFVGAEEDPSVTSRTDSYGVAWFFVDRNPFFGRGLGTFLPKYRIFDNQYLQMMVSIGIIGVLLFAAFIIATFIQLARVYRACEDPKTRDLVVALIGAAAAGFAGLAFFDAFAFPMTMGTIFLVLGLASAVTRLSAPSPSGKAPPDRTKAREELAQTVRPG